MSNDAKLLCIEDEPTLLEDLAEELRDADYEVFEARDGRSGLEAVCAHNPDLILCDMMMPEMDGAAVLKAVRALPGAAADTPFVFLTAKATRDDIIDGKKLGADDYLTKPIDFDLLLATVEARLRQVGRIKTRTEKQLLKLYRKFEPATKQRNGTVSVGLIAPDLTKLETVHKGLVIMGCVVWHSVSVSNFVNQSSPLPTDIVFVVEADDLAPNAAEQIRSAVGNQAAPVYLLGSQTPHLAANIRDQSEGFDRTIAYPYRPSDVFKAIFDSFDTIRRPVKRDDAKNPRAGRKTRWPV